MSTDYGTDVRALDDDDDPEVLVSGDTNLAYALARRWVNDPQDYEAIGETLPYDCIDARRWFGARLNLSDRTTLDDIAAKHQRVLLGDDRVLSATVVATFAQGTLTLNGQGIGSKGAFGLIVSVGSATVQLLRGG